MIFQIKAHLDARKSRTARVHCFRIGVVRNEGTSETKVSRALCYTFSERSKLVGARALYSNQPNPITLVTALTSPSSQSLTLSLNSDLVLPLPTYLISARTARARVRLLIEQQKSEKKPKSCLFKAVYLRR
jgi:hypothetical protein